MEVSSRTHRSVDRGFTKSLAQSDMAPLMSIRKKLFDELSDQFVLTVAKQFCQLAVCELDSAVEVDNEDAIRLST